MMTYYKLLLTGATGFLGAKILPILKQNYAVTTCGRSSGNDVVTDLSAIAPALTEKYDVVVHAAAKAHSFPKTKDEIQQYFDVNVTGTQNLCAALERAGVPRTFVFISSVAVYGCKTGVQITEDHPLEGVTAYAKSKIDAERFLTDWCHEHDCKLVILRPSLIAGANAPANLRSMVNGIRRGMYANITSNHAEKSMVMAEDIANVIPYVIDKGGVYNVCDSADVTFAELSALMAKQLHKRKPMSIPYSLAWILAKVGDLLGAHAPINTVKFEKITLPLTFSSEKLRKLGWTPIDVLSNYKVV